MTQHALIFDVDGTLAETEEAHRQAFNDTFTAAGLTWHWTPDTYRHLLKTTGGKERMQAYRAQNPGPSDAEVAHLHAQKTARYAQIAAHIPLRPGVNDLITAARASGRKLAIATTTSRPNVDALCLAAWGQPADQIFDVIAAGDEVPAKKPAPDIYLLALHRLNLQPHQAIALEDRPMGLASAQSAGLRTLITPSLYTATDTFPTADWVRPSLTRQDLGPDLWQQLTQ